MREIVFATRNQGKLREVRSILSPLGINILSLEDISYSREFIEDGDSYLRNAQIKSFQVAKASGKITLADDSGLEIDALKGEPGLHSARFGGVGLDPAARNKRVLDLLKTVPWKERAARFRCVISICRPELKDYHCEGVCEGIIADRPEGEKGFGYDPIFFLPDLGKTMAELSAEEKNTLSHRGRALKKAKIILNEIFR